MALKLFNKNKEQNHEIEHSTSVRPMESSKT